MVTLDLNAELAARLDAQLAERQRRRDLRAATRAEMAEARTHGLAARHATKLRRSSVGEPTQQEESK